VSFQKDMREEEVYRTAEGHFGQSGGAELRYRGPYGRATQLAATRALGRADRLGEHSIPGAFKEHTRSGNLR